VSDEQLFVALSASVPMWNPPTVPCLLHELRLWGKEAVFSKQVLKTYDRTGAFMVETLLSDKACRERTVQIGGAFLLDSPYGVSVVVSGSMDAVRTRAEGHYGQLLNVLAEAGVPSTTPVTTSSGRTGTVADVLQDAMMRFSWTRELDFIGPALARWLPPETTWMDRFGNEADVDGLVAALLKQPLGKGSCSGCHVPHAVVIILRVDERYPLLSETVRRQAHDWLIALSAGLDRSQLSSGGWDENWSGNPEAAESTWHDPLLDRISATGHHLEWIALAEPGSRPSEEAVRRAVEAVRRDIDALPSMESRSFRSLLPVSHAARALALLRLEHPYTAWRRFWDQGCLVHGSRGWQLRKEAKK